MSQVAEVFNPLFAGGDKPQTGYKLEASSKMLRETCQECERLLREFDENRPEDLPGGGEASARQKLSLTRQLFRQSLNLSRSVPL